MGNVERGIADDLTLLRVRVRFGVDFDGGVQCRRG